MHASDGGDNWKMFLEKLGGRLSKAKCLLVIQTRALYESKICLKEIHHAFKRGVEVVPIGFEDCLLVQEMEKWPMVGVKSPPEDKQMLLDIDRWALCCQVLLCCQCHLF